MLVVAVVGLVVRVALVVAQHLARALARACARMKSRAAAFCGLLVCEEVVAKDGALGSDRLGWWVGAGWKVMH